LKSSQVLPLFSTTQEVERHAIGIDGHPRHFVVGSHYILTISEIGNANRPPGRKFYSERAALERDLRKCLNQRDAEDAARALRSGMIRNTWTAKVLLTEDHAAQLGWSRYPSLQEVVMKKDVHPESEVRRKPYSVVDEELKSGPPKLVKTAELPPEK
jgi:hypothetical protein